LTTQHRVTHCDRENGDLWGDTLNRPAVRAILYRQRLQEACTVNNARFADLHQLARPHLIALRGINAALEMILVGVGRETHAATCENMAGEARKREADSTARRCANVG
jgi:hypothetical protein